jgi:hypothetical protein
MRRTNICRKHPQLIIIRQPRHPNPVADTVRIFIAKHFRTVGVVNHYDPGFHTVIDWPVLYLRDILVRRRATRLIG